jgi:hypothetical protein
MAEQHHPPAAGAVLLGEEVAAEQRLDADGGEEARGDMGAADALGDAVADQVEGGATALVAGGAREDALQARLQEEELGRRHRRRLSLPEPAQDEQQPIGPGQRQRPQEQAVGDAEDGGVGADRQRQRDHRDGGESRLPRQAASPIPKVPEQ